VKLEAEPHYSLAWCGETALKADVRKIRADLERSYEDLVMGLERVEVLTPSEAAAANPQFVFIVEDKRTIETIPLPEVGW
jgi:hypothetical protein